MDDLPTQIKLFDVVYQIEYVDNPSDVDMFKRDSLWGQLDYWTRTIRVYKNDRQRSDIWQTIWHELLHAICTKLIIETEQGKLNNNEKVIDLLATGINSILMNNGLVK